MSSLDELRAPRRDAILRLPADRRLSAFERARLAIEIVAGYRHARRALRRESIDEVVRTLRGAEPAPRGDAQSAERVQEARRLGWAVRRTLMLLPGDKRCLTRSLVLTQLLTRRGIDATVVIGARSQPSFLAHAWVECGGNPVLPTGEDSFGRLVEL